MKPIAIKELSRAAFSALELLPGLCLARAAGAGFTGEAPVETSPYHIDKAGQIGFCGSFFPTLGLIITGVQNHKLVPGKLVNTFV